MRSAKRDWNQGSAVAVVVIAGHASIARKLVGRQDSSERRKEEG
jgi:hypothetical protein